MNPQILPEYVSAIVAVRPDLKGVPMVLHSRGWDSNAVEVGDTIFKFPKRDEAVERLRREAGFLALVRPRVPLAVPDMVLHEDPMVFSQHRMIPGSIIETAGYEVLNESCRQGMAEKLAGFYAALHAIPMGEAVAVGAEPKPEWPRGDEVLPLLADRLPAAYLDFAARAFAAYAELPDEEEVFGYFDGHGWNMAFDHEMGLLNGVFDFADSGFGARHRDLSYSNWISADLTLRIIDRYEELTRRAVNRDLVMLYSSALRLAELAEGFLPEERGVANVTRWVDELKGLGLFRR